jgi:(2Fe-2S) ferredoxin
VCNDLGRLDVLPGSLAIRSRPSTPTHPVTPFKSSFRSRGPSCCCKACRDRPLLICIRDGQWPSREQDVEEVDVDKLKAMVHADEHRDWRTARRRRERAVKIRKELWFGFT